MYVWCMYVKLHVCMWSFMYVYVMCSTTGIQTVCILNRHMYTERNKFFASRNSTPAWIVHVRSYMYSRKVYVIVLFVYLPCVSWQGSWVRNAFRGIIYHDMQYLQTVVCVCTTIAHTTRYTKATLDCTVDLSSSAISTRRWVIYLLTHLSLLVGK